MLSALELRQVKIFFSDSEKLEILSGLQSLSAVQYPEADTILNKLGAIFQTRLTDWNDADYLKTAIPLLQGAGAELSLFPNI